MTQLGRHPFYQPPLTSSDEVRAMLIDKQDDVKKGLVKANQGDLFDPLMAQLPEAAISEVQYQKGQTFQWMFYRRNGTGPVRVDKSVVWEADTPMDSYEFSIEHQSQRYIFTVPPVCGNLALVTIAPIPFVPPPVVVPTSGETGTEAAAGNPGSGAGPQQEVQEALPIRFVADLAYLHQLDPSHHGLIRVGVEYDLTDEFSLLGMVGAAPKSSGTDGTDSYVIDLVANYKISRFFVGFGLGAWLTTSDLSTDSEDDDLDLILNFGARLFGEPDGFNTSLLFEVRSAVDELGNFESYGRVAAGLRFTF